MKKFLPIYTLLLITSISCSIDSTSVDNIETNNVQNPIIQTDDFFPGSNWNDPHVIHDGSQFVMYASAAQNFDGNVKIYRLVSDNGIEWLLSPSNPVLERSDSGWDSKSVETPAVVFYDGLYHMFYTGYESEQTNVGNYKIGHATSQDGIDWTKNGIVVQPTDPDNLTPTFPLNFMQWVVGEPGPVVFDGKIYLYFTATGPNEGVGTTLQVIGLTIYDGSSWSEPVSVLEPDQSLHPRSLFYGYSTPNAIVSGGMIHLYFDVVADPWRQVKIHRAVSNDGLSAWVMDNESLLVREDFAWTQEEIRSPSALEFNDKLYLYFAGHTGLNLAIGLKIY